MSAMSFRSMLYTLVFVYSVFSPHVAHAAYSVHPLVIDHTVEARSIERDDIVITNNNPVEVITLFPTVNNVTVGASGGVESFVSPSMTDRTDTFSSWIELSRKPVELRPGETTTTTLTIRVNPNAEKGVYHALVSFPKGRNRDEAEALIARGGVPGVIVNVTVDRKTHESMGLSGFHVDRFIFSPTNRAISYTLKNTGESDMHPSGDILIYNGRGEEVASLKINTENVIVKAGETHVFTTTAPTAGLLGKYKAYLSMTYGVVGTSAQTQLQDTAYFYAVPWKKLLMVFVALFLFALGIALYTHKKYVADVEHLVDVDTVAVHIREGVSEAVHHDIDMKPRI